MIDKNKMKQITEWLIDNIFRNESVLYDDSVRFAYTPEESENIDLIDVIASLHNLLYEYVTGERYDYMFHWANKEGADCNDHIFDDRKDEE